MGTWEADGFSHLPQAMIDFAISTYSQMTGILWVARYLQGGETNFWGQSEFLVLKLRTQSKDP